MFISFSETDGGGDENETYSVYRIKAHILPRWNWMWPQG